MICNRGKRRCTLASTFAHPASHKILDVTFGDIPSNLNSSCSLQSEAFSLPIGVTETHPFWSANRQAFVPMGEMQVGEQVVTLHGETKQITSILARPGPPEKVYNLEVNGEHTYFVGRQQLLVHNSCPTVGLGIAKYYDELGDASLAVGNGWGRAGITSFASHGDDFPGAFAQMIKKAANGEAGILFNLRGVQAGRMSEIRNLASVTARDKGLLTVWELRQVLSNPAAMNHTTFKLGERLVSGANLDEVMDLLRLIQ